MKKILVTGGNKGIGFAITEKYWRKMKIPLFI